ncbi:twin-arginine translocase TatA/TatE family subunit [Aeromicrobium tamlense]|uniref:Sec-independent protein translocase protein TatA n=1 Tax=Aeromicrobium tamlense TaxID=375541 RepID=A0A8I0FWX7_9ACTN|nr:MULTISPECIES: twin-arginine translocase TatA/TatE family subunit [Aeromicrobium]MBD1270451.1 twin-arginine translocase TatA/TatE family subunit [Aeromicrobium tamlense]MBD1271417.1 twin-arginine translocase TatA/TatE family subunit [Aeromicrobium tamlense]NYI37838.1 sec-independent protein translocase protein TatA [Aeromicrobium tamlense]
MPNLGATEILIILGIVILLFGGRKLPELARGSGRALRIFKSELRESEQEEKQAGDAPRSIERTTDPAATDRRDDPTR